MDRTRLFSVLLALPFAASAHEIRLDSRLAVDCNDAAVILTDQSQPSAKWNFAIDFVVTDSLSGRTVEFWEVENRTTGFGFECNDCFPGRNKSARSTLYVEFEPQDDQDHTGEDRARYLEDTFCEPGYAHIFAGTPAVPCRTDQVASTSCTILTSAPLSRIDNEPVSKIVSAAPAGDPIETAHENIRRLAHYRSALDPLRLVGLPRHCESIGSNASGFETSPGVLSGRNYYYRCGADFVTLQLTEQSERNAQNLADNANAYIGGRPAILRAARPAAGGLSLTAAWERDGLDFWATIESPTAQDEDILVETLGGVTAIRGAGPRTP
ncbi:hypothetical protein LDO32_02555 [Luteimonas sp. Y-2-2-4F]|nr:hypothetical protein [Luteimonas sp. Y-2-2-4F]MCD9030614.1 hypothetical protein [Luteimonas sp. Y-2-2-4F]